MFTAPGRVVLTPRRFTRSRASRDITPGRLAGATAGCSCNRHQSRKNACSGTCVPKIQPMERGGSRCTDPIPPAAVGQNCSIGRLEPQSGAQAISFARQLTRQDIANLGNSSLSHLPGTTWY